MFDEVFLHPLPLTVARRQGMFTEDTKVVFDKISSFIARCQFDVFSHRFRLDYVGHTKEDSGSMNLTEVSAKLRIFKLEYMSQGKLVQTNPDELYRKYIALTPALPKDSRDWGFNIVDYYWNALTSDVQIRMRHDGYELPGPGRQTTQNWWMDELVVVRTKAADAHAALVNEEKRLHRELERHLYPIMKKIQAAGGAAASPVRASRIGTDAVDFLARHDDDSTISSADQQVVRFQEPLIAAPNYAKPDSVSVRRFSPSPAESVMQRYKGHTEEVEGAGYPVNPESGKPSDFPRGFRGCMNCGDPQHNFRACPSRSAPDAESRFFHNLHAHKPHLCKRRIRGNGGGPEHRKLSPPSAPSYYARAPPPMLANTASYAPPFFAPPPYATPPLQTVIPTQSTVRDPAEQRQPYGRSSSSKKYKIMPAIVRVLKQRTNPHRPMPISVQNGMPTTLFDIGKTTDEICLTMMVDTGAGVNTGWKPYHRWIMQEHPELVHSYEECDGDNPFDPLRLQGALREDDLCMENNSRGHLTAVIRYYTPYV
ncbi:MAG: hypothetical protein ACRDQ5_14825, partial [Sciscionella sp.]